MDVPTSTLPSPNTYFLDQLHFLPSLSEAGRLRPSGCDFSPWKRLPWISPPFSTHSILTPTHPLLFPPPPPEDWKWFNAPLIRIAGRPFFTSVTLQIQSRTPQTCYYSIPHFAPNCVLPFSPWLSLKRCSPPPMKPFPSLSNPFLYFTTSPVPLLEDSS